MWAESQHTCCTAHINYWKQHHCTPLWWWLEYSTVWWHSIDQRLFRCAWAAMFSAHIKIKMCSTHCSGTMMRYAFSFQMWSSLYLRLFGSRQDNNSTNDIIFGNQKHCKIQMKRYKFLYASAVSQHIYTFTFIWLWTAKYSDVMSSQHEIIEKK